MTALPSTAPALPDLTPYRRGNCGIPHVLRFVARAPGPEVGVTALVHGNEICGAQALDSLLQRGLRPRRGTLTLIFANTLAYGRYDPAVPGLSRYVDEDMNRVWSPDVLDGPRRSAELTRARALRPVIDRLDLLLDLHSMQYPDPPLILSGRHAKGRVLARRVGLAAHIVADSGHAAGTRLRDYARFGDADAPHAALLAECGQHGDAAAGDFAEEATLRFLAVAGTIDPADLPRWLPHRRLIERPSPMPREIEVTDTVTLQGQRFAFVAPWRGMDVVPRRGTVLGYDDDRAVVTPYDNCVLIMPTHRLARGQTAVRLGRYLD